jgi:hypothetical protein
MLRAREPRPPEGLSCLCVSKRLPKAEHRLRRGPLEGLSCLCVCYPQLLVESARATVGAARCWTC